MAPQGRSGKRSFWFLSIIAIAILIWLMPSEKPKKALPFQVSTAEMAAARLHSRTPFNETVSRWLCEDAIRRRVSHPSTIDFHSIVDYASGATSDGVRVIWQTFSAKNDDEFELTYRARCEISPGGHLDGFVINEK